MKWDVTDVWFLLPLTLRVSFADETIGQVRFKSNHLTGVFKALKDPIVFAQARVEAGSVT